MALNNVLFFLGLVLGQFQRHPLRTLTPVVRGFSMLATALKKITYLSWATVQFMGFGLSSVVLLLVLANTLLDSERAVWASVFILGASRGVLSSAFRGRPSSRRMPVASAA
ncbi:MAG: hypothetical protein KDJ70_22605, partial [Candidatus Competibacteraceae bacterium]|nr:hypothetical protein [Candidatus Competibacteraceae bacterium]